MLDISLFDYGKMKAYNSTLVDLTKNSLFQVSSCVHESLIYDFSKRIEPSMNIHDFSCLYAGHVWSMDLL